MADDGHLENQKNRDISEAVWPILTKFCNMAHISPPELGPSSGCIARDDPSPLPFMHRDHNALPSQTGGQTDGH